MGVPNLWTVHHMYPRRVTDTVGDSVLFLAPPQTKLLEAGLLTADGEERVIG